MTWLRTIPGIGRLLGIIALITTLGAPAIGHAIEVKLSDSPVANILPLIVSNGNPGIATNRETTVIEFTVINDTRDTVIWRFRTEMLNPLAFEFYGAGQAEPFFLSPFKSRPQLSHASQGPVILSDAMSTEPGKSLQIRAQFEHAPGPDIFPVALVSQGRNDQIERRNTISHGIYFGAMLIFVILFILSANVIVSAASKWFGLYLIALTLLNAHSHGYVLSLLDLSPESYFPLLRVLQVTIMFAYLTFAMSFLNASERYPALSKGIRVFFVVGLMIAPLEVFAYLAVRDGHHGARFFAAGYFLLLVVGGINYVASIPSFAPWNDFVDKVTLALQSCDALIFGGAIFSQIYGLRSERDMAIKDKLAEYQEKLAVSQKLRHSETNLHRARSLAERHRASIASTSHDLRQPITSLRVKWRQIFQPAWSFWIRC